MGKNEKEARKKAEDFKNQQYNEIWDGFGKLYRTPHNMQFEGLRFFHFVDSISSITVLLSSDIEISTPRRSMVIHESPVRAISFALNLSEML